MELERVAFELGRRRVGPRMAKRHLARIVDALGRELGQREDVLVTRGTQLEARCTDRQIEERPEVRTHRRSLVGRGRKCRKISSGRTRVKETDKLCGFLTRRR